ncbi:MAG: DNA cytosine methyltransferase, partial [Prevotellaceae bacterium]|nr:DNA cytosine methyltransferase [Prevotellaceae bacterium]
MINLLYIDLFCGAGGTSTGVERARYKGERCAKVIACVNHDANAIASHAANHSDALHFTEDIRTLELSPLVSHVKKMKEQYSGAAVVLWASLECTNFSKAKGGKPRDADSRTLAEHLYRYIEAIEPDYIQIENVEEFMSWGDLDGHGKPISRDSGRLYQTWVNKVKHYGYDFDHRILNAADFGAYTSRKRFFGQFAKRGLPIAWSEQTHAKTMQRRLSGKPLKKWKPVKNVLDFSDEGESIFTRKKPLSDKTLERIYAGLIKFVAGGKDNFLSAYYGVSKNFNRTYEQTAKSTDEPCGVLTTENRFAKVQAKFLGRYNGQPNQEINAVSVNAPAPVITTKDRLSLVSPKFIVNEYSCGGQHSGIDEVCPAVLTRPKQKVVSLRPWIMNTNFNNVGSPVTEPSQTITANRKWHYLMNPQYFNAGGSVDSPCFTIIARMDKKPPYLITTETGEIAIEVYDTDTEPMRKIKEFMAMYGIIDIKMRMLKIPELKRIMGFPEDYTLIGTQAEQKKYIGNAVEVNMARVLCEALVSKLYEIKNKSY